MCQARPVRVHLVDGTYELFRQYLAPRPGHVDTDGRRGRRDPGGRASRCSTMLEDGATHLGVATDHVIESFRNDLWADYKDGAGIDPVLFGQFPLLEEALVALGVAVWPMVEFEADDALGAAAVVGAADDRGRAGDHLHARQGSRPVRRRQGRAARPAQRRRCSTPTACARSSACRPESIPDWLALVGDTADGFPGLPGFGAKTAAALLARYGHIEAIPDDADDVGRARRARRRPARGDARRRPRGRRAVQGPRDAADRRAGRHRRRLGVARPAARTLGDWCDRFGSPRLAERAAKLAAAEGIA